MEIMNRDKYLYISQASFGKSWLFDIPVDILLLIFEHSDYFTLLYTFPLVCRAFRDLLRPDLTPPNTAAVASPAIIAAMNRIMFRDGHTSFLANSPRIVSTFNIHPILSALVFEARIPEGFQGYVTSDTKARITPFQINPAIPELVTWHRWAEAHPSFSKLSLKKLRNASFWRDNVVSPASKYLNVSINFNERRSMFVDNLVEDEVWKLPDRTTKMKLDVNHRVKNITVSWFAERLVEFVKPYMKTGHYVFSVDMGWDCEDVLELSDDDEEGEDGNMKEGNDEIAVTELKIPRIDLKLQHWTINELHDCNGWTMKDGSGFQISLAM